MEVVFDGVPEKLAELRRLRRLELEERRAALSSIQKELTLEQKEVLADVWAYDELW